MRSINAYGVDRQTATQLAIAVQSISKTVSELSTILSKAKERL